MTRFLITLEQAVDIVFEAIAGARPGEVLVPKAPAATIEDVALALIGDRPIEMVVTGIRPGEKQHEILVSEEECHHTFERDDYYVIAPMLPELSHERAAGDQPLDREVSSADAVLGRAATAELLRRHRLMVDDVELPVAEELLR
jgi:UDP-glucose 4-epimerase